MAHAHHHPHPAPTGATPAQQLLMRRATYASVAVASLLLLSKLYAWWETDSLAMLSSFTDSVFDVLMSVMNMLALRYALKPADDDHPFGHTAIEDIAGLAQCAFIAASMALIFLQSVEQLFNPQGVLSHPVLGMGVSLFSMVMTIGLVLFQTHVTRQSGSLIIASDRLHYVGDILFNVGVLAAYALSSYGGFTAADPLIAIAITLIVLWNTRSLGLRAFNNLMGRELPAVEKEKLYAILAASPQIRGHHHLKTRYAGARAFIQMHVDLDATLSFREVHDVVDQLEHAIAHAFPDAEVIIHPDPV